MKTLALVIACLAGILTPHIVVASIHGAQTPPFLHIVIAAGVSFLAGMAVVLVLKREIERR